jgi:hypothetical protein
LRHGKYGGDVKTRGALLIMICSLILGGIGSAFAADPPPSRRDSVTSIQNQYNPLFDAQYARLIAIHKKVSTDSGTFRTYKALLADFLDMRRILNSGLASSTSDLDALKGYAEEEVGEFGNTISTVEATAAKIRTITCVKAKLVKKVTGLTPKCLKGYKKK